MGAAVLAAVAVVVAVAVGTEPPRPADDPPKAAAPVKEPEWKVEFRKAYGLKEETRLVPGHSRPRLV